MGLKGFLGAISAAFPDTRKLCIVHMVRNPVKYMPWKDYQPDTEDEALLPLDEFSERWDGEYLQISKSWRSHWHNLNTLFSYPEDIRKAIYTTNAIESLNNVIHKAVKKRQLFPTDDSAMKVIYLSTWEASKKWTTRSATGGLYTELFTGSNQAREGHIIYELSFCDKTPRSLSTKKRDFPSSPTRSNLSKIPLNSFSSSCCSATYHCKKWKVA